MARKRKASVPEKDLQENDRGDGAYEEQAGLQPSVPVFSWACRGPPAHERAPTTRKAIAAIAAIDARIRTTGAFARLA